MLPAATPTLSHSQLVISPTPSAHFGAGAVGQLPGLVRTAGRDTAVVVTDAALAATPVVASVAGGGRPTVRSGSRIAAAGSVLAWPT